MATQITVLLLGGFELALGPSVFTVLIVPGGPITEVSLLVEQYQSLYIDRYVITYPIFVFSLILLFSNLATPSRTFQCTFWHA
eukprot:1158881-Pelagomonas_calceolata.AAC.9